MKGDLLDVVEAAYRVELDESSWLRAVRDASLAHLDRGLGGSAFIYEAKNADRVSVRSFLGSGNDDDKIVRAIQASSPERVRWIFRSQACQTASEGPDWNTPTARAIFRSLGFDDLLFVNGVDPTGEGCFFTVRLKERERVSRPFVRSWSRIAAHLAAGFRLRARLEDLGERAKPIDSADVVLTPAGKIEHVAPASAMVDEHARVATALRNAVLTMDRARGTLRRSAPDESLQKWTALFDSRWSLLDHFDTDGRRFVVACSNEPSPRQKPPLTARERQVMEFAALGHSNKLIAYELGISPSTVGVLFFRATRKLGQPTREGALAAFAALSEEREPR